MKKVLIVIDMQKDFIDGALGTKEAEAIVEKVIAKCKYYRSDPDGELYATRDTHQPDYLQTQEGKNLPVEHCIQGTDGWKLHPEIERLIPADHVFNKPTFGSEELVKALKIRFGEEPDAVRFEVVGLCTDICVVSNALLLKAAMPEAVVAVDPECCAGVTPEKHEAALETMRSCQILNA